MYTFSRQITMCKFDDDDAIFLPEKSANNRRIQPLIPDDFGKLARVKCFFHSKYFMWEINFSYLLILTENILLKSNLLQIASHQYKIQLFLSQIRLQ